MKDLCIFFSFNINFVLCQSASEVVLHVTKPFIKVDSNTRPEQILSSQITILYAKHYPIIPSDNEIILSNLRILSKIILWIERFLRITYLFQTFVMRFIYQKKVYERRVTHRCNVEKCHELGLWVYKINFVHSL